jgi:hypothetical protein
MNMNAGHNSTEQTRADDRNTVGGRLSAALGMEDEISTGVYEEYRNRRRWPEQFDEAAFLEIEKHLTVLIEDTRKHKEIIEALIRKYG